MGSFVNITDSRNIFIQVLFWGGDFMPDIQIRMPYMGFTPIENVFIDEYMCSARGEFVKVYLLCIRLGYQGRESSIEKIASSLNLLQADVIQALEYWDEKGLLKLSPQGIIDILPQGVNVKQIVPTAPDNSTREIFEGIEKLIGRPLSSKEVSVFIHIMNDFSFTPEMINLLVEYCCSRKKTDIRYMEKVAIGWHDSGIKDYEDAQRHITKHEEKWNKYRNILNYMGIKDSDISKPQEEFLEKWLLKYKLPVEVINEACKICVMRINEINFSYIDAILGDWSKNGVKSLKDLEKPDKKHRGSKQANSGSTVYIGERKYDIDKLEKQLLGRNDIDEK